MKHQKKESEFGLNHSQQFEVYLGRKGGAAEALIEFWRGYVEQGVVNLVVPCQKNDHNFTQ